MKNFISTEELNEILDDENLIILDCRADLKDLSYGEKSYEKAHIKNAVFLNVKKILSGEVKENGGRTPLPDMDEFKERIENLGIGNNTRVVAYDDYKISGGARLIWMLRHIGHTDNFVLDGGIEKWLDENRPVEDKPNHKEKNTIDLQMNKDISVDKDYVKSVLLKDMIEVVDSRAEERHRGIVEPIDRIGGCIKGAKNHNWKKLLNDDKTINWDKVKKNYTPLKALDEVVLYCGSGIDACFNYLLMDELGIKAKVYIGSWSDWITYEDNIELIEVKGE